jgi:hypothetical protein
MKRTILSVPCQGKDRSLTWQETKSVSLSLLRKKRNLFHRPCLLQLANHWPNMSAVKESKSPFRLPDVHSA